MIDSRIIAVMNFMAGDTVADIGADHGYLSIELARSGRATKIIATEKNIGPFSFLQRNILASDCADKIETRLGDGLKILSAGEVETICICGMGGILIKNILEASPEVVNSARRLILQPMNATEKIREWFSDNKFVIVDEELAESAGIIYEIICAEKFSTPNKIFKRDESPLLKKFLMQRARKLEKILSSMNLSESARTSEKFAITLSELDELKKRL